MAAEKKSVGGMERVTVVMGANGEAIDLLTYIADKPMELIGVLETHNVAGSDAGAVTLDVKKCASGTAAASGTTMLSSTFNLKSTAATPVTKSLGNGGLTSTATNRILKAGDQIGLDFTGTTTALAGVVVKLVLRPIGPKSNLF